MIRSRKLNLPRLNAWLANQNTPVAGAGYRLRVWRENRSALAALRAELHQYLDECFEDAKRRLRRGFEDALSPFSDPAIDPAANYPALLHRVTLQGYFGETLAVLAVEHWGAHGQNDWVVPALLFRFHDQEFQHLELINERIRSGQIHAPDETAEQRPGRTGDDAIAFRMNTSNAIVAVLTLEAKCLAANRNATITEAHEKLVSAGVIPSGIRELINILADYDTPLAQLWQQALLQLRTSGFQTAQRNDGIAYACGAVPNAPRASWMNANQRNAAYTVNRGLEAMEFQFADLSGIINMLYRGA